MESSEVLMPWDTSIKELWHGTTAGDIDQLLLEGLDQRVAARGHFGRGLYFSDHPGKAHRYTTKKSFVGRGPSSEGIRTMLRCKVQLGKTKEYPRGINDTSLLREPSGYDSVVGNISGQNEMVVYDNDRVLIEYVVRYTVTPVATASSADRVADIARELRSMVNSTLSGAACLPGGAFPGSPACSVIPFGGTAPFGAGAGAAVSPPVLCGSAPPLFGSIALPTPPTPLPPFAGLTMSTPLDCARGARSGPQRKRRNGDAFSSISKRPRALPSDVWPDV
jgi:hypothetical protein